MELDGTEEIFCATSSYGTDGEWYDWCLIEWEGYGKTYAARILGFFQYTGETSTMVVVQSAPSTSPMSMDRMTTDFVSKFCIPENLDDCTYVVPIDTIVNPLCVFKNYGGPNREYFCTLPQRKWGHYFGVKILGD